MKKIIYIAAFLFLFIIFHPITNSSTEEQNIIKFSSWGSQSETAVLKEIISEFEKKSGKKVEFIHIPQNYFQKIHLLFASGLQPDVVFLNNQNIQMYIKAGLLEDLRLYIDEKSFYKEALDCFSYENGIYAVPRDISTLVIYYNKDIFKELKINAEEEIKDLNSLISVLKKIRNKKIFGMNFEEDPLFWSYFLAANGGGIISDDGKNLIITNKQSIYSLKLYSDLINTYHIMPTKAQIGSKTTAQMFINGELAMYLGGRWMVPKFRELITFNWDIIPFPVSERNKVYSDASGWAITKKSKNKQAAVEFINYLSSENSLKKMAETGLIIPANISAAKWTINEDKNKKPENSKIFLDMLEGTKPTPVNENYAAISDIIKEKAITIFTKNENPEDIFDKTTVKKLESLIK